MNTGIYASLHFLVDLTCAWSMFAFFSGGEYENLLIYNFCAFALQMPFGALADLCKGRIKSTPRICAAAGIVITVAGAVLHPAILGIGNALFHVGGGMDVIAEDFAKARKGRNLGLFVAPGAIGLYIGTVLAKSTGSIAILGVSALAMSALMTILLLCGKQFDSGKHHAEYPVSHIRIVAVCCFAVVILRSWVGLAVSFDWKNLPTLGFIAVFCAAGGKFFGGILASRYGLEKTATVTLIGAALCYCFAEVPVLGLSAVLLFNMSMPLTLYLLVKELPHLAGFSFGLLTFGLCIGFLPVFFQMTVPISGNLLGAFGGIISCILMSIAGRAAKHDKIPA